MARRGERLGIGGSAIGGSAIGGSAIGGSAIGDLAVTHIPISGSTSCAEAERRFSDDPSLRSLVVFHHGAIGLINRSELYQGLTGRLGYGWALFHRRPVSDLLAGLDTQVVDADADAVEVGLSLLSRGAVNAANDILVRFADDQFGTVPVMEVLAEVSRSHAFQTQELGRRERRARALLQASNEATLVLDSGGHLTYASPAYASITGNSLAEVLGRDPFATVNADDATALRSLIASSGHQPGQAFHGEFRFRGARGRWLWCEITIRNMLADPAVNGTVVNMRDVTAHHDLHDELHHLAFHDTTTGLANRALFADRLHHALDRLAGGPGVVAVAFIDLDGFKGINDTMGHEAGDELLIAVARRLASNVRHHDTLARIGGDEFALVLEGETRAELDAAVERQCRAFDDPVSILGQLVTARASIGVAMTTTGSVGADLLLRQADGAMYASKAAGGGCRTDWSAELIGTLGIDHRLTAELAHAIDEEQLILHYQPVWDLGRERIAGFEALVRWNHPERGLLVPDAFIPAAERSGLINNLGQWVLRTACAQAARWQHDHGHGLVMSVNVSSVELMRSKFSDVVLDALVDSGLDPALLEIEITETALLHNTEAAQATLEAVASLGVSIAVDDFGTGYASLTYLRRFPVTTVKIDRSFVAGMRTSERDEVLVEGLVKLAASLSLSITAEGVEFEADAEHLRAMGCHKAQGYLYAKPQPSHDAELHIRALSNSSVASSNA